jgi:hypothetical protein
MPRIVNPYTFIPMRHQPGAFLQNPVGQAQDETYTGVITCTLETKTPLSIPAKKVVVMQDAPDPHYYTEFFRVGGNAVIPASSLRGPIRSVFEQLTGSCMRANDEKFHSLGGKKKPGVLASDGRGGYKLYKAKRYRVTKAAHRVDSFGIDYVTGVAGKITTGPDAGVSRFAVSSGAVTGIWKADDANAPADAVDGIYMRVNQMAGETPNVPSVFVRDLLIDVPIDPSAVACLRESVEEYVENSAENMAGPYAGNYKECLDQLDAGMPLPVWYGYDKNGSDYAFQFAWAELSRSVYPVTPLDFIGAAGKRACTSKDDLCPACSLFGFVGQEESGECKASRVRFTDALPVSEPSFSIVTMPALLGPRPSAFEFYLRNQAHAHSFSPQTPGTTIAGRKAYWHHQGGIAPVEQIDCDFNARVECVNPGAVFAFDVFFDKVTKKELNALVYALSLGQYWDKGKDRGHKIGHGKPIGAGSVFVKIDNVLIRTVGNGMYRLGEADAAWVLAQEQVEGLLQNVQAIRKVTQFTAIGAGVPISYPRISPGGDIFDWFGENRVQTYDTTTLPGYKTVLPSINDNDQGIERQQPNAKPNADAIAEPETCIAATGTIVLVRNLTGAWWGEIAPDAGGTHPQFGRNENLHIEDTQQLQVGQRVSYVARMTDATDRRGRHVRRLRAFELEFI